MPKFYYIVEIVTSEDLSDIADPFLQILTENVQKLTHQCQGVIDEINVTPQ